MKLKRLDYSVFFWALAAVLVLFRVFYIVKYPELIFAQDSFRYVSPLALWDAGLPVTFHFMAYPGYPLIVFVVAKTLGLKYLAVFQHLSLALACVLLAWTLVRLRPSRVNKAVASGFLLAVMLAPSQFCFVSQIMTEGIQTQALAVVFLCWYLAVSKNAKPGYVALLSLCAAGFLYLRPGNLPLVPVIVLCLALAWGRRSLWMIGLFLGVTGLCLAPWMYVHHSKYHHMPYSTVSNFMLATSYSHLFSMDSAKNKKVKDAIRDIHGQYLKDLQNLPKDARASAGTCSDKARMAFCQKLMSDFDLSVLDCLSILGDLAKEGVSKHPGQAARLFFNRCALFYGKAPSETEKEYGYILKTWGQNPLKDWAVRDHEKFLKPHGVGSVDQGQRRLRQEKAGAAVAVVYFFTGPFSRLAPMAFWLSILLFPCALFSSSRRLCLFLFLYIHASCLMVCLTAPPESRYFQPLVVYTWLLLAMELACVPEIYKKIVSWKNASSTSTRS